MARSEIMVTITVEDLAEHIENGFLARVEYEEWQGHLVAWPHDEELHRSLDGDYLMIRLPTAPEQHPSDGA